MKSDALDCSDDAAKIKRRTLCPHHKEPTPRALCVVDPRNPELAAALILARIKVLRRAQGAGSFLFVSPSFNAYVLNEQSATAADWAGRHWAWFVGAYTPIRGHQIEGLDATLDGITEDVACHLAMSVQA